MKKYNFILAVLVTCFFFGCEDEIKRPKGGTWNTDPIKKSSIDITPLNGGATITYDVDNEPEMLYVMAEYERNGQTFTEKSSVHTNFLTIEGFHRVNNVKVKLYKVNRKEERSEPIEVDFQPLESLIDIAHRSWLEMPSFGGFVAYWDNPEMTELGVRLMMKDEERPDLWATREMYFSAQEVENHAFRGFESEEMNFAVTIEDKWGNISDTIFFTLTPFFETLIKKPYSDYRANIPYDNISNYSGRTITTLWDDIVNTSSHGWLTMSGQSGTSITIDLQQVVKLSRIVKHPYHLNSLYSQANITEYEAWGIDKIDYALLTDRNYWLDSLSVAAGSVHGVTTGSIPARTFKDDWTYLGYHTTPLGLNATDAAAMAQNGVENLVPIDAAPVRYVRIFVRQIALAPVNPNTNYFSCSEITFYGDNTVPQE